MPAHFEQAAQNVSPDEIANVVVCGPEAQQHIDALAEFESAGFDHVFVHQVGPAQEPFLRFYETEILTGVTA